MKKITYFLIALLLVIFSGQVWADTGATTTHGFLYKPPLAARGQIEKNTFDAGLDRVDARLGKEIWVGDPNYGTTFQAAVTAIGSNNVILRVPAGTHNITADLTVPANITLKPERGAVFTIATGKTLTINGGLEAGSYPVFSYSGTGKAMLNGPQSIVRATWFPGTDIGAQINNAVAACGDTRPQSITVTAAEWNGAAYSTPIIIDKPVKLYFPGPGDISNDNGANFSGTVAACKVTARGVQIYGFRVNEWGNTKSNVDGLVISGASNCIFHDTMVEYCVRRGIAIDGAANGAYNNFFSGVTRVAAGGSGGSQLWFGTTGAGIPNANEITHLVTTTTPDSGYSIDFARGLGNKVGYSYINDGGATATAVIHRSGDGPNFLGDFYVDGSLAGTGVLVTGGILRIANPQNEAATPGSGWRSWAPLDNNGNLNLGSGVLCGNGLRLPHTINKIASANVRHSHDAEASAPANVWLVKLKTITFPYGLVGQQRILCDLKTSNGTYTAYARVRKNGDNIGAEQSTNSGTYVTKSQDITETWNPGDTCELWAGTADAGVVASVQNFRIAYDDSPTVAVVSMNSTP